ncbi:GNAT family N-acetyltransferase [Pseudoalteromonas carrageenovora]|uniref:GNAT family N-acetyltransferase n=1 Tax=Pseudoalteromonas carrageenovora TaxID=227 RepID=UPI0026E40532|nr:GNAT family N-acetyltransferase [Pseudoalteromonas carrageenovora]MDO6636354.1 GNAT family N-acetyltransferase [Pseudoalteromonas carrageenovora]MDO6648787.1 GNAT family N-acetyltransferase [Pseudoalteromonas carrageenovora]
MKIEKITTEHDKKSFDCGVQPLNNYLKTISGQHEKKHLARTFVLSDGKVPSKIIGFYTLAMMSIDQSSLPPEMVKKLPKGNLNCSLLGRLAIDIQYQGQGHGEFLLIDAIRNSYIASLSVPTPMLVVDAKDDKAKEFYEKYGFIAFPDEPYRLFLTMKDSELLLNRADLI